jgi:ubiquinone/menaquinone biosynthesis C-methylase UbiE
VRALGATTSRFDRRAHSYQDSALQQFLFGPVQETALQLALQLRPQARRILDVGCGSGQLLRRVRPCYPSADLVGVDLAGQMVAAGIALTPPELAVHYLRARAEQLPFVHDVFDLAFATLSFRHWTNPPAGIAEISRVLNPGGLLVLADVFSSQPRRSPTLRRLPRSHAAVPSELGGILTTHRLTVVGYDRTSWFRLPDVQVIASTSTPHP